MSLEALNFSTLKALQGEQYLYLLGFSLFASLPSSLLVSLYTLKDKNFFSFMKKTFLSSQLFYCVIFAVVDVIFCTWLYGYGQYMWFVFVILMILFVLSYIDCICLAIPDWLNFALLFFVFGGLYYFSILSFEHFVSAFGICGALSLLRIFGEFVFGKEIMGEADIVVLASMGAMILLTASIYLILLASILAMGYVIVLSMIHLKGKQIALSQIKLPFVLFLSLAFVMILLYLQYPLWGELGV